MEGGDNGPEIMTDYTEAVTPHKKRSYAVNNTYRINLEESAIRERMGQITNIMKRNRWKMALIVIVIIVVSTSVSIVGSYFATAIDRQGDTCTTQLLETTQSPPYQSDGLNTEVTKPTPEINATSGMIDDSCSGPEDCAVQNSECRSEKICGCVAGYSFLPENEICVADCIQYGTTFQYFEHKNHGGGDESIVTFSSVDECFKFCIDATTFICVAFLRYEGTCYFQSVDASDLPSQYIDFNDCYYYQRNCA